MNVPNMLTVISLILQKLTHLELPLLYCNVFNGYNIYIKKIELMKKVIQYSNWKCIIKELQKIKAKVYAYQFCNLVKSLLYREVIMVV